MSRITSVFFILFVSLFSHLVVLGLDAQADIVTRNGDFSAAGDQWNVNSAIIAELKKQGADDIIVFVGGVIPKQDYEFLYASGVKGIYGPGTPIPVSARDVLSHIEQAVQAQK